MVREKNVMRGSPRMVTPIALALWLKTAVLWTPTKIFSVLLRWLLKRKKWPGEAVRAFNDDAACSIALPRVTDGS